MNKLSSIRQRCQFGPHTSTRVASLVALTLSVTTLTACSSVSEVTKQRVANSGVTVQQAHQSVGRSEAGMMELQHAKEGMEAANKAVARSDDETAQRMATRAELHAQLAVAQAQSADARRAADGVLAGTDALRKESERTSPPTP